MTLDFQDLLRSSRIAENLRRSDPELLAGRHPRVNLWRPTWRAASYGALTVCVVLSAVGLAISSMTAFVVGGVLLAVVYPVLLVLAEKERRKRLRPERKTRLV